LSASPPSPLYPLSLHDALPISAAWFLIFEDHGAYEAKLVKTFPGYDEPAICSSCKDDRKNEPVVGLTIIRELKRDGFNYTSGNLDRKSTRLNSSHVSISYAVFC